MEDMEGKKNGTPRIGINLKDNYINIGSDVIRELNHPDYITFFISENFDSIAVKPCVAAEVMSFKVPEGFTFDKNKNFRIYSIGFTSQLKKRLKLKAGETYHYKGEYDEKHNAVIFPLLKK